MKHPMNLDSSAMPVTIDCHYLRPEFAASFLLNDSHHAAFVETNTRYSIPYLLKALTEKKLSPNQVEYIIITHVHLDHSGGAFALMKECPQATVLAHPRAAPHLIDPTRLVASARQVYGESQFQKLYGNIDAIDANRVRALEDGEQVLLGNRKLHFFHTRGHANHHFCIYDSGSNGVFTGDSFGLAYPMLQSHGLFIFPSTSPTDFDPEEARKSIQKILATGAERAFLTHYGAIHQMSEAADQLNTHLDFCENLLWQGIQNSLEKKELQVFFEEKLKTFFKDLLERRGLGGKSEIWEILNLDLEINAAGIAHQAIKRRTQKT
jgi:glyoxylase-like metal-dependent hydrolase (beta-lactamase superfamily II)